MIMCAVCVFRNIFSVVSEFAGPYLHMDTENWIGNNFMDEFSVVSREAHCNSGSTTFLHWTTGLLAMLWIWF